MSRLVSSLSLVLLVCACRTVEPMPEPGQVAVTTVWASPGSGRSYLRDHRQDWPLKTLNPSRAERLAAILFPEVSIHQMKDRRKLVFASQMSAEAFVEASRWTDGMILALRTMEKATDTTPADPAGTIFENLRRYLLVDDPSQLPDWAAVSKALHDEDVWRTSPNIAGVGAIVFAGLILRGQASDPAKDRAKELLGRAVVLKEVPAWLSWIAQLNWTRRDLLASDDKP